MLLIIEIQILFFLVLSYYFARRGKGRHVYKVLYVVFWIIVFFNSFIMEKSFFVFDMNEYKLQIYFFLKISFLLFIILIAKFLYNISISIINENRAGKDLLAFSLIYFVFCMTMLLIYYPGSWKWDEIWILYALDDFVLGLSQHFLTAILYSWGIMLLGSPVGVIILFDIFISIILGYCTLEVKTLYKTNMSMVIFIIPFMIMPPIIDNNMYPLRHSLYSYLCMLLFVMPIIDGMKKRKNELINFSMVKTIGYIILITLVCTWRNEGIYYLTFPVVLTIFFKKYISTKKKILLLICPIICTLFISTCQHKLSITWNSDQNTVMITLNFFYDLIEEDELSQEEINSINKVLDVERLKKEGVGSVWNGLIRNGEYSIKDFNQFKNVYIKNVFKHPIRLAKLQWPIFKKSNGDVEYFSQFVYGDVNIYDEEYLKTERGSNYTEFLNYPGIKVINESLREIYRKYILLLEDTKSGKVSEMCQRVYSCYIPLTIFFIYMLILLLTKKLDCFIFSLFTIGRLPIVFITSPDSSFMYYYPNYIIGIVAASFIINDIFNKIYEDSEKLDTQGSSEVN